MSAATDILKQNGLIKEQPPVEPKPNPGEEGKTGEQGKDVVVDDKKEPGKDQPDADTILLEGLRAKGFNINSIDDLRKPQEKELTEEDKERDRKNKIALARKHALENKLVTEDVLASYDKDIEKGESLAFDLFKEEFLGSIEDPELRESYTDEDIVDMWNELNYVNDDDTSVKKKLRKQKINKEVKAYLNEKYGEVLKIEQAYDNFQNEIVQAQQYKGIVEQAVQNLPPKFSYDIDGVQVFYEPTPEALEHAKQVYLAPKAYQTFGKDATVESLTSAIQHVVTSKEFERVLKEASLSYYTQRVSKEQMGRRGIIDRDIAGGGEGNDAEVGKKSPAASRIISANVPAGTSK